MLRRPPGSTLLTHSFPTRRSSDLHEACGGQQPERPARRPVEARAVRVAREHHRLEIAAEQQRVDQQREDRRADPGDEQQNIDGQREQIAADQADERGEREADILPPADIDRARRGGGIMASLDIGDDRVREEADNDDRDGAKEQRSEEHTSELQSLMRLPYAVFCFTKNNTPHNTNHSYTSCNHYAYLTT